MEASSISFVEFLAKNWILTSAWVVVALLLVVATLKHAASGIKSLSNQEVTNLVNREEGVVIDVRAIADFSKGHIHGALNIPLSKLKDSHKDLEKYKSKPIILVCANGIQAGPACTQLKKAGFEQVHKLNQGMAGWLGGNLPVDN